MLLDADAESANGNSLGDREHQGRTGSDLTHPVAPGSHDADAVDVRSTRVNLEDQSLLLEETELYCHDFTELVSSREPAELEVEERDAVDVPARRYARAASGEERLTEEVSSSHGAPRVLDGASARQVYR